MDGFDHILNWKLKAGSHPFPGRDGGTCINEAALIAAGFEYRRSDGSRTCQSASLAQSVAWPCNLMTPRLMLSASACSPL